MGLQWKLDFPEARDICSCKYHFVLVEMLTYPFPDLSHALNHTYSCNVIFGYNYCFHNLDQCYAHVHV